VASLTEPFASGDSFLHDMDPRIRLLAALVLTVPVAVLPALRPAWLALAAGLILVKMARLNMLHVLNRLLVVNLFIVFLWFFLPFSVPGEPVFDLGPLHATAQGIDRALLITVKSNAVVVSLMALLGTISIQNLGPAMQQLGVPDKLCHIFSIYQEYTTMRQAMRARGFKPRTDTHTYRTYAWLVGMLLVKSWDRAERVHGAMLCRGFRGRFYSLTAFETRPADYLFLLGCAALSASLIYMGFIQGRPL
jgi:cobalt/nickel transport system permease protein